jgi:hypothetical protein
MWEPRRLTTLWSFRACYRDSFRLTCLFGLQNPNRLLLLPLQNLGTDPPMILLCSIEWNGKLIVDGEELIFLPSLKLLSWHLPEDDRDKQWETSPRRTFHIHDCSVGTKFTSVPSLEKNFKLKQRCLSLKHLTVKVFLAKLPESALSFMLRQFYPLENYTGHTELETGGYYNRSEHCRKERKFPICRELFPPKVIETVRTQLPVIRSW